MQVQRSQVMSAAAKGLITTDQAEALWRHFEEESASTPGFRFGHVLYYLGGLIMIGAMSLFMTLGWEAAGGWFVFGCATAYAVGAWALMRFLLYRKQLVIPAGIMLAFVVALTPLAVYGLQAGMGVWKGEGHHYRDYHYYVDWGWLVMELATLLVAVLLLYVYRLPFAVMPVAVTLWYMSMDLGDLLARGDDWRHYMHLRAQVSAVFGFVMILLALWIDFRSRRSPRGDFGFWMHLYGVAAFWGGLANMGNITELGQLGFGAINMAMIFGGTLIGRRVYAVFGGLGVAEVLGYFSYRVFKDSLMFPFALSAIGLGIVVLGIVWQKHERRWTAAMRSLLPPGLRGFLEARE